MEQADCQGAKYWLYSVFEYYSNNILFVFVFGQNSEPEYYSYSYSAKYLCTNIIRIRIRSFWKNEYYSYSYSVQNLIPNIIRIRIRSKKQSSLTSVSSRPILLLAMPGFWRRLLKLPLINPSRMTISHINLIYTNLGYQLFHNLTLQHVAIQLSQDILGDQPHLWISIQCTICIL